MSHLKEILDEIRDNMKDLSLYSRVWLNPQQLAQYIDLSKNTIYQYVQKNRIPFHKIPGSSRILFNRLEIDAWIAGRAIPENRISPEARAEAIWDSLP
jgi:excisionase family DNA binding protein